MKLKIYKLLLLLIVTGIAVTSCLDGEDSNIPDSASGAILELIYNPSHGTTINSGLQYFSGAALLFSANERDTVTFVASLQGASTLDRDVAVTALVDNSSLNINFAEDSINYLAFPDSLYDFVNKTVVIPAGERSASFQIVFYNTKIDFDQNYALPISVTNDADVTTSSNFGSIYFHLIGNPIAGSYKHDFIRYSNAAGTGNPDANTYYGRASVFAPVNSVTIHVPTGYYDGANYFITFKDNEGELSDFKAELDPASVNGAWATAGIVVTNGPTITVNPDYTIFTIKYTTLTRNVTDIYYK
jgi:hypothetical protein